MLSQEINSVYFEITVNLMNALLEKNADFLNVISGGAYDYRRIFKN